jgi:hypothetical protein
LHRRNGYHTSDRTAPIQKIIHRRKRLVKQTDAKARTVAQFGNDKTIGSIKAWKQ